MEKQCLKVIVSCLQMLYNLCSSSNILNHKDHTSFHPCSKYNVSDEFYERYVCSEFDHIARTDIEYANDEMKIIINKETLHYHTFRLI